MGDIIAADFGVKGTDKSVDDERAALIAEYFLITQEGDISNQLVGMVGWRRKMKRHYIENSNLYQ